MHWLKWEPKQCWTSTADEPDFERRLLGTSSGCLSEGESEKPHSHCSRFQPAGGIWPHQPHVEKCYWFHETCCSERFLDFSIPLWWGRNGGQSETWARRAFSSSSHNYLLLYCQYSIPISTLNINDYCRVCAKKESLKWLEVIEITETH